MQDALHNRTIGESEGNVLADEGELEVEEALAHDVRVGSVGVGLFVSGVTSGSVCVTRV